MHHKKKFYEVQSLITNSVSAMKATLDTEFEAPSYLNIFNPPRTSWTQKGDPPKYPPVMMSKVPAPETLPPVPLPGEMPPPPAEEAAAGEDKELIQRLSSAAPSNICRHGHDLSARGERSICMCIYTSFVKIQQKLNEAANDKPLELIDAVIKTLKETFYTDEIYTKPGVCFFYILLRAIIKMYS